MRYGIFGDIHGNGEALRAFQRELTLLGDLQLVCLGDSVGYGSSPNECLDWLRHHQIPSVMGNHEYALHHPAWSMGFNPYAKAALAWQDAIILQENRSFSSAFPFSIQIGSTCVVSHADFIDYPLFSYLVTGREAERGMRALSVPIGFFGHTHQAGYFILLQGQGSHGQTEWHPVTEEGLILNLRQGNRYLINPGSIGQPRDRNPQGAFILFDEELSQITFKRFVYDWQKEGRRIIQVGLPPFLAERLVEGI